MPRVEDYTIDGVDDTVLPPAAMIRVPRGAYDTIVTAWCTDAPNARFAMEVGHWIIAEGTVDQLLRHYPIGPVSAYELRLRSIDRLPHTVAIRTARVADSERGAMFVDPELRFDINNNETTVEAMIREARGF